MRDFYIDLLKYDSSEHMNTFINNSSSNCLHSQIPLATRRSGTSKPIIDNIFSNISEPLTENFATGNITFSIFEYTFSLFFFLLDFCSNSNSNSCYKKNSEVYDWNRFNKNLFLDDFNKTN